MPSEIEIEKTSGMVNGALIVESPNQDFRPDGADIEVLVVHSISLPPGQYGGSAVGEFFLNRLHPEAHPYYQEIASLKVSAHLFVRRDGEVVQFVPLIRRAWHAGESYCEGRTRVNDFSIGVEMEGTDTESFTDDQYSRLAVLTRALMRAYPAITARRIYAHSDIAPGRKTDPGVGFQWTRFLQMIG